MRHFVTPPRRCQQFINTVFDDDEGAKTDEGHRQEAFGYWTLLTYHRYFPLIEGNHPRALTGMVTIDIMRSLERELTRVIGELTHLPPALNAEISHHTGMTRRFRAEWMLQSPLHPWNLDSGAPCRNDEIHPNSTILPLLARGRGGTQYC